MCGKVWDVCADAFSSNMKKAGFEEDAKGLDWIVKGLPARLLEAHPLPKNDVQKGGKTGGGKKSKKKTTKKKKKAKKGKKKKTGKGKEEL